MDKILETPGRGDGRDSVTALDLGIPLKLSVRRYTDAAFQR